VLIVSANDGGRKPHHIRVIGHERLRRAGLSSVLLFVLAGVSIEAPPHVCVPRRQDSAVARSDGH
jgi:hypothetical protein